MFLASEVLLCVPFGQVVLSSSTLTVTVQLRQGKANIYVYISFYAVAVSTVVGLSNFLHFPPRYHFHLFSMLTLFYTLFEQIFSFILFVPVSHIVGMDASHISNDITPLIFYYFTSIKITDVPHPCIEQSPGKVWKNCLMNNKYGEVLGQCVEVLWEVARMTRIA